MRLNGRNVTFAEMEKVAEPTRKILTHVDPRYERQNVGL